MGGTVSPAVFAAHNVVICSFVFPVMPYTLREFHRATTFPVFGHNENPASSAFQIKIG